MKSQDFLKAFLIVLVCLVVSYSFANNQFTLSEFRRTHQEYKDWSDLKLLSALYEKYGKCQNRQLFVDELLDRNPQTEIALAARKLRDEVFYNRAQCSMKAMKDINPQNEAAVLEIRNNCLILNPIPCEEAGDKPINLKFDENGKMIK